LQKYNLRISVEKHTENRKTGFKKQKQDFLTLSQVTKMVDAENAIETFNESISKRLETFEDKFEKKLKDLELELGEMEEIKEKLETLCAKVDGLDTSSSGFGHSVTVIEAELKEKTKETENTQRQMV
jgi:hypothetical protein